MCIQQESHLMATKAPPYLTQLCRRLFLDKLAAVRARSAERRGREAAAVMEAERRAAAAASAEVRVGCVPLLFPWGSRLSAA